MQAHLHMHKFHLICHPFYMQSLMAYINTLKHMFFFHTKYVKSEQNKDSRAKRGYKITKRCHDLSG